MKKWIIILIAILTALLSTMLVTAYIYGPNFNFYLFPPSPNKYGKIAIQKMDTYGYYSNTQNWKVKKKKLLKEMSFVKSYSEANIILSQAVKYAGGKHSQILVNEKNHNQDIKYDSPKLNYTDDLIIVKEPQFVGTEKQANDYANRINSFLLENSTNHKNIIIDLSGNNGGDMSPMILGLSSIIPDGNIFSFVSNDNKRQDIYLKDGKLNAGGADIKLEKQNKISNAHIAVIIDKQTGSSGELTALALKSNQRTKLFGEESAGYTSVNNTFPLYSGTNLFLTTAGILVNNNKYLADCKIKPNTLHKKTAETLMVID